MEYSNSRLRAIIAGHEGIMKEAIAILKQLHVNEHDYMICTECNVIKRLGLDLTNIHGDD